MADILKKSVGKLRAVSFFFFHVNELTSTLIFYCFFVIDIVRLWLFGLYLSFLSWSELDICIDFICTFFLFCYYPAVSVSVLKNKIH